MPRASERERFVRDFFRHFGAAAVGPERGPFTVQLSPGLRRRLRVASLEVAFRADDLESHPGAQLMVPGNPIFDRIVAAARRFGGLSRRYRRARGALRAPQAARLVLGAAAASLRLEPGAPCYRSSFLFTFRVAYRALESVDEIHAVAVSELDQRCGSGNGFFCGLNLGTEAEPGIADQQTAAVDGLLGRALEEVERRIEPRVERFCKQSATQLQHESERLKRFFTDLIAEEKARQLRRKTPVASVEAAERKLEWVQRLDSENRLFAPEVTVALIGIEEIRVPVLPLRMWREPDWHGEADLDLASGELSGLRCASCESELAHLNLCTGEHMVCEECLDECAACAR